MIPKSGYFYYLCNIKAIFIQRHFRGWGRKRSGRFASWCHQHFGGEVTYYEDGFLRSVGLGVEGSPSFSFVEDDVGIYYDATRPSRLENILNTYDFNKDTRLMAMAQTAIALIKEHKLSKYNHAPLDIPAYLTTEEEKVLIIAQTAGDASLTYGFGTLFSTKEMIKDALCENPEATIYLKIHPDVLSGKKDSDIRLEEIPSECIIIEEDIHPIVLLNAMQKVYTKTSGMGMEALLLGKEVHCYGLPYYAGWKIDSLVVKSKAKTEVQQVLSRRGRVLSLEALFAGAYILYTHYYNPYRQKDSDILETIQTLVRYRNIFLQDRGKLFFFGFSHWKRKQTLAFFPEATVYFCQTLEEARKRGIEKKSTFCIWGKKAFREVEAYAKEHHIAIQRVEDGFVRSVSLGSDLTKAYSLVVDRKGIYFDPTQESDLESLLNTYDFDEALLKRAQTLQRFLIENKISKYNIHQDKHLTLKKWREGQRIILVPGQVEDDASIRYGAKGMTNLALLKQVREGALDAYILYKPHPDVLAGNRVGDVSVEDAMQYCDEIITDASIDSVLALADEVHTMTSLVGFEALIRKKRVKTYGMPFYAGWGVTEDTRQCERRVKKRTLDELVAAAFLLYPRYLDPKSNQLCEIETLLGELDKEKKRYNSSILYKMTLNSRNIVSRKIQFLLKMIRGR